jgi:pimeloyl-ACP methyl ester carboxylesterase
MGISQTVAQRKETGYAPVNGLNMYYEITGAGAPVIYIPAVFAFAGAAEFPELAKRFRVVQVDLQGHGRTSDIDRPLSFQQHAKDIVALMHHLEIERAHLLGWSYGGLVAMIIAMQHPELVDRVATYGSLFGPPADAIRPEMVGAPHELSPDGPDHQFQHEQYKRVAPHPDHWPVIWKKIIDLVPAGFTRDEIAAVRHRVLVALGDNDFIRLEHALCAYRSMPNAELAVIPDASHFLLYEQPWRLEPVVAQFFSAPAERLPFGTIETGYYPGQRR